jgi:hypothetical protein
LIEVAANTDSDKWPASKMATRIVDAENESHLVSRAINRVAEHLKPIAEIDKHLAEAAMLFARADQMDTIANQRAERLIDSLSAAVGEEVVLPVDVRHGVVGVLIQLADDTRKEAYARKQTASMLRKTYDEKQTKKGA